MSISYNHGLINQWFSGWDILWVSNDIYLILDSVKEELLFYYIPFLDGLYLPIYDAV